MPVTVSAPPPKTGKTASSRPRTPRSISDRTEALTGIAQVAQVPLVAFRLYADAGAVAQYAPGIAREVANLAEKMPAVARIVDPLIQVGPYSALITAALPLILQLGVNHGRLSPGAMGTVPASALSAQVESAIAMQELEALRIQQEAEQEAARIRSEIRQARESVSASA